MPQRIVICFDGTWSTPGESFAGPKSLHERSPPAAPATPASEPSQGRLGAVAAAA